MDRAQTPAFGLASSLEAMIEASLATSLERRLMDALNQQLGSGAGKLEDRIEASVSTALEQRLSNGSLDALVQSQVSAALDQRLGSISATIDSKIQAAVTVAVQSRLGAALRAQIIFDVLSDKIFPPPPSHDSGHRLSTSYQHNTIEREDTATLKQETESGAHNPDIGAVKPADAFTQEEPGGSSLFGGTNADDKTCSVREKLSVMEQLVAPIFEKESLPSADIAQIGAQSVEEQSVVEQIIAPVMEKEALPSAKNSHVEQIPAPVVGKESLPSANNSGTNPEKTYDVATTPARVRKEIPKKPKYLPGMGIRFPPRRPAPEEEREEISVDHVVEEGDPLFVEQDETETETEAAESMPSTPAEVQADAMQARLPASKGRSISNNFANLLCELGKGAKVAEFKERTLCAKCGDTPDDAHVISCLHVYCEECLAAMAYEASSTAKDEIACVKCLTITTEAEPCSGLLSGFKLPVTNPKDSQTEPAKKPSKKRTMMPAVSEKSDAEEPKRKKAKKTNDPPGMTDGPDIKFLLKKESKLSSAAHKRGHPRIVDVSTFTELTNKKNFTMADIVATILWNYKPEALKAFFEVKIYPKFRFARKETEGDKQDFVIERELKEQGLVVTCGHFHRKLESNPPDGTQWDVSYEYIIEDNGRWNPHAQLKNDLLRSSNKSQIQQWATELGAELFFRKVWAEDQGAEISTTVWTSEATSKGKSIFAKPGIGETAEGGKIEKATMDGQKPQVGKVKGVKAGDGKANAGKVEDKNADGEVGKPDSGIAAADASN